jgi:hypothetical protein
MPQAAGCNYESVTESGGYTCPTACEPGCPASCHERHKAHYHRNHDPDECDQRQLGRDVTPLPPPASSPWRPAPPAPVTSRAAYARALKDDRVRWWRRLVLRARGPGR